MVEDLNIPVRIKVLPTVRQKDGLAMSSRNSYLNKQERQDALVLFHSLKLAQSLIRKGQQDALGVIRRMKALIQKKKSAKIDYLAIADTKELRPLKIIKGKCLIALAVWIGKTRLIDNLILDS
jgi:pantoate--beta-alanine ligase